MENVDVSRVFFAQPARVVANELQSRVIIDAQSGKKIRIEGVQPFRKVGSLYLGISNLNPGDLWTPYRRTLQSLVVVRKEEDPGSCVRILNCSYFDEEKQEFVYSDSEGTAGTHLGMGRGQRGTLRFQDATGILYLIKGEVANQRSRIPAEDANKQLKDFILGNQ